MRPMAKPQAEPSAKRTLRVMVGREKAKVKMCTRVSPRQPVDVTGLFARPRKSYRRPEGPPGLALTPSSRQPLFPHSSLCSFPSCPLPLAFLPYRSSASNRSSVGLVLGNLVHITRPHSSKTTGKGFRFA